MATKPENPSPIFNLPIFIPQNWINTTTTTTTTTSVENTNIIGEIIAYQGTSLPSANWLWCNGTAYNPTLYSDLFNTIGYNYGSSSVANPASSSTSAGDNVVYSTITISKNIPTGAQSGISRNTWTIVIPSNTAGGGSYNITSPLFISNTGSFTPFGSATLTITTTFSSISYSITKDGSAYASGITTPIGGAINPFIFQVSNTNITSNYTANSFIGNYSFNFTPAVQSTSSTYVISYVLNYFSSSSVSGGSTSYNNTATPTMNASSASGSTSCDNGGTIVITSQEPGGYDIASATWTGNTLFLVPNLLGKTPIGSDAINIYTTTYQGTPVSTGGNRNMNVNQLGQHNHAINSTTPTGMLQNLNQNNAIQTIGQSPNTGTNVIKSGLGNQVVYTATAGNTGNSADLLPPFSVSNFIIRAVVVL